jgi:hypothetical protein
MVGQPDVGIKLPQDGDVDAHGLLLHEAWLRKKSLASKITSDVIEAYHNALVVYSSETRGSGNRTVESRRLSAC